MRKIRAFGALALLGAVWVVGPATPSGGTEDNGTQVVTHIIETPDNGCPAWARDSMARTTTVEKTYHGVKVSFHDAGVFKLPDGRQGTLVGDVRFNKLDGEVRSDLPDDDNLDNTAYGCKTDVPGDRTVGQWPLRYVDTQDTPELKTWEWTYTLCGVSFTENAESAEVGPDKFPAVDDEACTPPETTTTTSSTVPETTTTTAGDANLFENCDEAVAAGHAPLHVGDVGYRPELDADHDGVACEDEAPVAAPPAAPVVNTPTFTG